MSILRPMPEAKLQRMATVASRPSWELRARAAASARYAVPAGLFALVVASFFLRSTEMGIGLWIDEGLSVGIAERSVGAIPHALREDGAPPLYYVLLHFWLLASGHSEWGVRGMSLFFALISIPAAWWAGLKIFATTRAAWIAAVLVAFDPFLTQYAQETRMYSLIGFISIFATTCFLRAYVLDASSREARRPWIAGFAVSIAAALYTHNWAVFFTLSCLVAMAYLLRRADRARRRELLLDGLFGFGGAFLLYLPWIPTTLSQAAHTGAPWSNAPAVDAFLGAPGVLLGRTPQIILLVCAIGGLVTLLRPLPGTRSLSSVGRATLVLIVLAVLTVFFAWGMSQISPAWANRYLLIALPPLLLIATAGLANAGRVGLVGLLLVSILWLQDTAPVEKSNVRAISNQLTPSLRPGDLVIVTQPESIAVVAYYLPHGVQIATLTGIRKDTGVWDWRDGVTRLEATTPRKDLAPLVDRLPAGRRVVLIQPIFWALGQWQAPWTKLVRLRSREWEQWLSNDAQLQTIESLPLSFSPPRPNPVQALVMVKTRR